jgi:hypothetical protein
MRRVWVVVYAASLLVGVALWRVAARRWGLEFPEAILLGSALYFGALNRYTVDATAAGAGSIRWIGRGGLLAGLIPRAALFLAIAGVQAYVCFEWVPTVDVRAGFVLSTTWLAALGLLDAPRRAKEAGMS